MLIYEGVAIRNHKGSMDEYRIELLVNPTTEDIEKMKLKVIKDYEYLTENERKTANNELRVYSIPDDIDASDSDELTEAMCDCDGYDVVFTL